MAGCTHPPSWHATRYELTKSRRRVLRLEKCNKCRRILRRVRCRWASRRDRRSKYDDRPAAQRRTQQRDQRQVLTPGERLLTALRDCAAEARYLPQDDDRVWKYHPVARRYRRLVRAWWQLPRADYEQVCDKSPTWRYLLSTGKRAQGYQVQLLPFSRERVERAAKQRDAEGFSYRLYE